MLEHAQESSIRSWHHEHIIHAVIQHELLELLKNYATLSSIWLVL